ncbi:hypothetical protein DFJ73DRAFT_915618 [Zopfochytrium polystomum]|nr:hypothetical protein DFJ73DRAFT_915618 [Zopfochytrium polystomum]
MDALPVLSQVKSLVQFISGDSEGAKETQENFSRQLPVVPQLRSLVECIKGDNDAARSTQESCGEFLLGALDGMPVIGHVKGGIHYALGQQDRGDQSMKAASRTVGVLGGGVGGFLVGGPLGAAVGGVSGGAAVDCLATGIHSATRREFTPSGQIAAWARVHQLAVSKDAPKAKIPALVFEAAVGITMDALSGYFAGESVRAFQAKAASGKVTSTAPVDGEMGSPPDFAAGANSVKPEPTYAGEPIPNEAWVEPGTELYRAFVSPAAATATATAANHVMGLIPLSAAALITAEWVAQKDSLISTGAF